MGDRLILALDGSTQACTAALLAPCARSQDGWEVVAGGGDSKGRSQAQVLLQLIDDMLREVGGRPCDLGAIIAGTGPGTFTGVRITVATARALALALHVPVMGISTLAALAAEAASGEAAVSDEAVSDGARADILVPVIDARRGQVFYCVYRRAGNSAGGASSWERLEDHGVCDRETLPGTVRSLGGGAGGVLVVGDASLLPAELGGEVLGLRLLPMTVGAEWLLRGQGSLVEPGLLPAGVRLQAYLGGVLRGAHVAAGLDGAEDVAPGEVGSPESVRPIYVRAPDADVHITKMRDPWTGR